MNVHLFIVVMSIVTGILITASQAAGPKIGWVPVFAIWFVLLAGAVAAALIIGPLPAPCE